MDKFDRAIENLEKEGLDVLWAIPVDVLRETFGMFNDIEHNCLFCKQKQTPLVGFTFVTTEGDRVVGYVCDHLDCDSSLRKYNQISMIHIDEDSTFNKKIKIYFGKIIKKENENNE